MSFTNIIFLLAFLPVFLFLYRIVLPKSQKPLLVLGGVVFYCLGQHLLVLALIASVLVNYLFHRIISKVKNKIPILAISIVINAGILVACKLLGTLPLGISFYTFQVIALLVDTKDEKLSFLDFAAMTLCFPRLIMGPLVRYEDYKRVLKDAELKSLMTLENLEYGLKVFTIGLGLKVILADRLATLWNSICVSGAFGITTSVAWLGALCYTLELYFDFWGYSLMAVGLGKALGLPMPENFNEPYSSKTIGEFWRRWHITLGEWFKSFVYIPMGGNKKGAFRTVLNLFTVWLITGIWHGMNWNFLIWSGVLFLLIIVEKFTPLGKLSRTKVAGHLYVLAVIPITWVIFATPNLKELWTYIKVMFGVYSQGAIPAKGQLVRYLRTYAAFLAIGAFFITPLPRKFFNKFGKYHFIAIPLLAIFVYSIYLIIQGQGNVFLYFSF